MDTRAEMMRRLQAALPDARITLNDMTGGGDHWEGEIVSASFAGQPRLARYRAVYAALGDMMPVQVHAFTFKALTPAEAAGD
ncbi:MAG: BolA/IbaG family iron-sulfur metabolism protein [bacterium]